MPWTDATFFQTTETAALGRIVLTFTDLAEFPEADPFIYTNDRQNVVAGGLAALKTAANTALAAERTRRQNAVAREIQILNAMNT